jgi:hypothetical protein
MSFRLWIIFYVFALLAAAMATFGPAGIPIALGILGFWTYVWKRDHQAVQSRAWLTAATILVCILALLVIAQFASVRGTARRIACMDNLKVIQLGILNYEAANGIFPPAAVTDGKGKPLHSWRILILPYTNITNSVALYKQYNFNEPWDGPNNRCAAIPLHLSLSKSRSWSRSQARRDTLLCGCWSRNGVAKQSCAYRA